MIGAMVRAVTESVVVSQSQVAFDRTPDTLLWVCAGQSLHIQLIEISLNWPGGMCGLGLEGFQPQPTKGQSC